MNKSDLSFDLPRTHIEDYMRAKFRVRGNQELVDVLEPELIDLFVTKPRQQRRLFIASLILALAAFIGVLLWMPLGKPQFSALVHLLGVYLGLGLITPFIIILWNYTDPSNYRWMKQLKTDKGKTQLIILLDEHQILSSDRSEHTLVHQNQNGSVKDVSEKVLTRKNCLNLLMPGVGDPGLIWGGGKYSTGRLLVEGEPPFAVQHHLNMPGKKLGPFLYHLDDDKLFKAFRDATLPTAPHLAQHFALLNYIRKKRMEAVRLGKRLELGNAYKDAIEEVEGPACASHIEKIRSGGCGTFEDNIVLP